MLSQPCGCMSMCACVCFNITAWGYHVGCQPYDHSSFNVKISKGDQDIIGIKYRVIMTITPL